MRGQMSIEARQRGIITRLKNENKKLRVRVKYLEEKDKTKDQLIETLTLQVKELQTIVFGKKKNNGGSDSDISDPSPKTPRTKESFRRATPREDEITKEESFNIDACPDCGSFLIKKRRLVRYIEDISKVDPFV